jgi:adenylosuccinate lyase
VSTRGEIPIDLHITPIDGRNYHKIKALSSYFSERALNRERIYVEIHYLLWLSKYRVIRKLSKKEISTLSSLLTLTTKDYCHLRDIESQVNHDVKAIELYIQQKISGTTLNDISSMVHFGLTSDDINSCAYARCVNESVKKIILPIVREIHTSLQKSAKKYKNLPMLARTHGQPATGTTYGKEIGVFVHRLEKSITNLQSHRIGAKLSGNVGTFNAHVVVFPQINWLTFSKTFLLHIGVEPEMVTTQIAPYDTYIQIFQTLLHINLILLGFSKDMWLYTMLGYVKQKNVSKEVGSTALPHKINPIYLEGAEGGFEIANSLLELYIRKLSYSRLQRDLSDSTVRRSFGTAFSYSLLSYQSILEACNRMEPNEERMKEDLLSHFEILSEAIQNYLRTKGFTDAYEKTKQFFRGHVSTKSDVEAFILNLSISKKDKVYLLTLNPLTYTGLAHTIVDTYV